jgi:hypothetical protein
VEVEEVRHNHSCSNSHRKVDRRNSNPHHNPLRRRRRVQWQEQESDKSIKEQPKMWYEIA